MTITQRKRQLRMAVRRDEQLISICDRARSDQAVAIQVLALPEYRRPRACSALSAPPGRSTPPPFCWTPCTAERPSASPSAWGRGSWSPGQITSLDQLHRGAYGVLEPEEDTPK